MRTASGGVSPPRVEASRGRKRPEFVPLRSLTLPARLFTPPARRFHPFLGPPMFGPSKKPTRIGQWNGRRRSSRSDEPVLPQLLQKPVLLRMGAVLVTALTVTFLA